MGGMMGMMGGMMGGMNAMFSSTPGMVAPMAMPTMMGGGSNPRQDAQKLFHHLDGKGDFKEGMLSFNEFQPLLQQLGMSPNLATTLWQMSDLDRSGTLSQSEF